VRSGYMLQFFFFRGKQLPFLSLGLKMFYFSVKLDNPSCLQTLLVVVKHLAPCSSNLGRQLESVYQSLGHVKGEGSQGYSFLGANSERFSCPAATSQSKWYRFCRCHSVGILLILIENHCLTGSAGLQQHR
jgi:hypothetical protein